MKSLISTAEHTQHDSSRRQFLKVGAAAAGLGLALGSANVPAAVLKSHKKKLIQKDQSIAIYNMATGETLKTTFWADGKLIPDAMRQIDHIMRDHHTNQVASMDPKLILLLHALTTAVNARQPLHLVCGYRSARTNAMLAAHHGGVARHSMHVPAKAADIFIPGRELSVVRKAALGLHAGGVGYYPRDNWVHVDTGPRIASWVYPHHA